MHSSYRFEEGITTTTRATVIGNDNDDAHARRKIVVEVQMRRRLHSLAYLLRIRATIHVHQYRILGFGLGIEARWVDEHGIEQETCLSRWYLRIDLGGHRSRRVRLFDLRIRQQERRS
jgi:hypothetical protein